MASGCELERCRHGCGRCGSFDPCGAANCGHRCVDGCPYVPGRGEALAELASVRLVEAERSAKRIDQASKRELRAAADSARANSPSKESAVRGELLIAV